MTENNATAQMMDTADWDWRLTAELIADALKPMVAAAKSKARENWNPPFKAPLILIEAALYHLQRLERLELRGVELLGEALEAQDGWEWSGAIDLNRVLHHILGAEPPKTTVFPSAMEHLSEGEGGTILVDIPEVHRSADHE